MTWEGHWRDMNDGAQCELYNLFPCISEIRPQAQAILNMTDLEAILIETDLQTRFCTPLKFNA